MRIVGPDESTREVGSQVNVRGEWVHEHDIKWTEGEKGKQFAIVALKTGEFLVLQRDSPMIH